MKELLARIGDAKRIFLISHVNPDGDAVASLLGLKMGLESLGKEVEACLKDGVPAIFSFLLSPSEKMSLLPPGDPPDLCIILDASDSSRTGFPDWIKMISRLGRLAYVDHHTVGNLENLAQTGLRDTDASSTSELITRLLMELGVRLTQELATRLLTGIYTDTGGFLYPNTTPVCMDTAAELMRRGAKLQVIVQKLELSKSLSELKLLGIALERAGRYMGDSFIASVLAHEDFKGQDAAATDMQGIVGQLNSMDEGKATLLLSEGEAGVIRGSLRVPASSKQPVHRLARILGGGGHERAAGFTISGTLEQTDDRWRIDPPE